MNTARVSRGAPRLEFISHSAVQPRATLWGRVYGDSALHAKYTFMTTFPGSLSKAVGDPVTTWDVPLAEENGRNPIAAAQISSSSDGHSHVDTLPTSKSGRYKH